MPRLASPEEGKKGLHRMPRKRSSFIGTIGGLRLSAIRRKKPEVAFIGCLVSSTALIAASGYLGAISDILLPMVAATRCVAPYLPLPEYRYG